MFDKERVLTGQELSYYIKKPSQNKNQPPAVVLFMLQTLLF